ncbi:MAG: hypothetical protein AVDCRST_MAG59-3319, partial [uncultured Thermomicrobiales bacterium]
MDDATFDALARGLAARLPRRGLAAALAAAAGLGVAREAGAQVGAEALVCRQFCRVDAECNAGLRCGGVGGRCFKVPDTRLRCNGNGNCPARHEVCTQGGRCVNALATGCPECRVAGDCRVAGARCRAGRCVVPPECV